MGIWNRLECKLVSNLYGKSSTTSPALSWPRPVVEWPDFDWRMSVIGLWEIYGYSVPKSRSAFTPINWCPKSVDVTTLTVTLLTSSQLTCTTHIHVPWKFYSFRDGNATATLEARYYTENITYCNYWNSEEMEICAESSSDGVSWSDL